MGKADMLNKGARKTGAGLFKDMIPLEARKESVEDKKIPTKDDVNNDKKADVAVHTIEDSENEAIENETSADEKMEVAEAPEAKIEQSLMDEIKTDDILDNSNTRSDIKSEINDAEVSVAPASKKAKEPKSGSRYEKEKFLLLDIRGYRDYIEHMAKAANMSATKYIRNLIKLDMDKNMDIYEAHKALEEKLKGRSGN